MVKRIVCCVDVTPELWSVSHWFYVLLHRIFWARFQHYQPEKRVTFLRPNLLKRNQIGAFKTLFGRCSRLKKAARSEVKAVITKSDRIKKKEVSASLEGQFCTYCGKPGWYKRQWFGRRVLCCPAHADLKYGEALTAELALQDKEKA
jgi:hypothetical protein